MPHRIGYNPTAVYQEIKPSLGLTAHVDAYWRLQTGRLQQPLVRSIYPDGCIDIMANMGTATVTVNCSIMKPGALFLAGTMTTLARVSRLPNMDVIGIRFKPGAFPAFYSHPLEELRDTLVDFQDPLLVQLLDGDEAVFHRLDGYYQNRKYDQPRSVLPIVRSIGQSGGRMTIDGLARLHHLSPRTLERAFRKNTGITPKELASIVRFQSAYARLKNKTGGENLAGIALETGYYDQAHLTNEIKKYTGMNPSQL